MLYIAAMSRRHYGSLVGQSALIALIGFIAAGPFSYIICKWLYPQPRWISGDIYAKKYHAVQHLPYYLGFFMLIGFLMLFGVHYLNSKEMKSRVRVGVLVAFGLSVVYAMIMMAIYIIQISFVRNMALEYSPMDESVFALFNLHNPKSITWHFQIWSNAVLGVATWFMAAYYRSSNGVLRQLLIVNGILSLLTAACTVFDKHLLFTEIGTTAQILWNALIVVILIMIYQQSQRPASALPAEGRKNSGSETAS